ncbi:class II Aldolase and Adducin domain-containing protein [Colletotrichum tabaci]|uniref:Class II Aldolase and Adducin domain-containing protein n=1 Tax=Colletotrichum tabaci TaxID=1209068 RepID=A0AAV9T8H2_9PEZI
MSTATITLAPSAAEASLEVKPDMTEKSGVTALSTGGYEFPGIPDIPDLYKKRQWQLEHMAGAFRVFARKGFTEGTSGHISVRDPVDPNTFWINPLGKHFGMLKASDMVHIDDNGQVIGGNRAAVNAAGFMIHTWSTFGRPLDIISQDTCNFWGIQAVYKTFGGVVLEADESEKIAATLGEKGRVIVLQNHGLLTTGGTVDEAAYLFTLMEKSCEVQIMVESTGLPKNFIGDNEAEFTAKVNADPETLYTEFQPDFEYEIWKSRGELHKGD